MKGWYGESARHALAARGITLKSRKELDYALHRRGETYSGEMAQHIWYDLHDRYPDEFSDYQPIPGEILKLRNIKHMMDLYERRKHRTLTPQEIGALRFQVKDFMSALRKGDPLILSIRGIGSDYDRMDGYLKQGYPMFAADTALFLLHQNEAVVSQYLGREPGKSISSLIVYEALSLQRGGQSNGDEIPIGEGQHLIDIWIEELDRRRLT